MKICEIILGHYEMWHHHRELAYAMNNGRHTAMPPTYPFRCDTLAMYLQ